MNYISPDALKDAPLDKQILSCARSLASMAAIGELQVDGPVIEFTPEWWRAAHSERRR